MIWTPQKPRTPTSASQLYHDVVVKSIAVVCTVQPQRYLQCLDWWRGELSSEDHIPEPAGDTETVLVVHKVMLEMVFLQLSPVRRESPVVKEVMGQIVANVAKDTTTKDSSGGRPVVPEDGMS
jgi:hypothetical protein